jgi:hypothetical protein
VLTNSAMDIPVTISLSRAIYQKLNLLAADTPTNVMYGKLPDFFAMKGTIGAPKEEIKKTALAGIALKSISSVPGSGTVGSVLNNVGSLFGGGAKASKTNAPAAMDTNAPPSPTTNPPAKKQDPVNNLLNNLFGPKKK